MSCGSATPPTSTARPASLTLGRGASWATRPSETQSASAFAPQPPMPYRVLRYGFAQILPPQPPLRRDACPGGELAPKGKNLRARDHRSNSCVPLNPYTHLPLERQMRRAGGGQVGVNSTRTKRNRRAPTRIDDKENSLRPFSSGARGREFESPRSDQ